MSQIDTLSPSAVARFWAKIDQSGSCWTWTAHLNAKGYGQFGVSGRNVKAHRFAYELLVGPIPAGLVIDHLCRNRACCNPDHMEPVTGAVNILRGVGLAAVNARKTKCLRGHPLSGDNLCVRADGERECRECRRAWQRAWNAARAVAS
jgi:hypothetical protein